MQQNVMSFNGSQYKTDAVLTKAKSGPVVRLTIEEMNLEGNIPEMLVSFTGKQDTEQEAVVVVKQLGKYTVLFGKALVLDALANGFYKKPFMTRLISHPALKACRIDPEATSVVEATSTTPTQQRPHREQRRPPRTPETYEDKQSRGGTGLYGGGALRNRKPTNV